MTRQDKLTFYMEKCQALSVRVHELEEKISTSYFPSAPDAFRILEVIRRCYPLAWEGRNEERRSYYEIMEELHDYLTAEGWGHILNPLPDWKEEDDAHNGN